ncbi:MAG: hypothetical protein U0168_18395 [Nannocystaceae bacterium]
MVAGDDVGATEAAILVLRVHATGLGERDEAMRWRGPCCGTCGARASPRRCACARSSHRARSRATSEIARP